jgi:hypothetical protein
MYYVCETYELFDHFFKKGNLSKCFYSDCLIDIFRYLTNRSFVKELRSYDIDDLRVRYHSSCSVNSISYDIYLITTDRFGKENYLKKYKCPQALCYLVHLKDR